MTMDMTRVLREPELWVDRVSRTSWNIWFCRNWFWIL